MQFKPIYALHLCLAVLLCAGFAAGKESATDAETITVIVNNAAAVPSHTLQPMEEEIGRIFLAAGVKIDWSHCPGENEYVETNACRSVPGPHEFVVNIVPNGRTTTDTVYGIAFLSQDGKGKYCDIFVDRIREVQKKAGISLPRLMASVTAHELGHLLLGSHSHSMEGIMMPRWDPESVTRISMGGLLFTRKESALMRDRLSRMNLTAETRVKVGE